MEVDACESWPGGGSGEGTVVGLLVPPLEKREEDFFRVLDDLLSFFSDPEEEDGMADGR